MKPILFLFLSFSFFHTKAQTVATLNPDFDLEQKAVLQVIMDVFDGMKKGDSALVKKSFTDDPKAYTIFTKDDKTVHRKDNIQNFFNIVGSPHEGTWNEYSWNYEIKIDDSMAQVWCDYAFYLDDKFSHCGVDAFQLVKLDGDWKIFVLSDTRRKEGCNVPAFNKMYKPD